MDKLQVSMDKLQEKKQQIRSEINKNYKEMSTHEEVQRESTRHIKVYKDKIKKLREKLRLFDEI